MAFRSSRTRAGHAGGKEGAAWLPSYEDLPAEDGIPLEDDKHGDMARIYLIEPLRDYFSRIGFRAYVSGNSFVYYEPKRPPVGPDVYVVNGGEPRGQPFWITWQEGGLRPTLAVEFLSPSTRKVDRGKKFRIYRDDLQVPDYFMYDALHRRLEAWHLQGGEYVPALPDAQGRQRCASLDLSLAVVDGWVRWFEPSGQMLLTGREAAAAARAQAEVEQIRAREAEAEVRHLEEEVRRLRGG